MLKGGIVEEQQLGILQGVDLGVPIEGRSHPVSEVLGKMERKRQSLLIGVSFLLG